MEHIKTPTEVAFEKAREYDAISGYLREYNLVNCVPTSEFIVAPSNQLLVRYGLEWGSLAAIIIGHLEQKFNESKSKK